MDEIINDINQLEQLSGFDFDFTQPMVFDTDEVEIKLTVNDNIPEQLSGFDFDFTQPMIFDHDEVVPNSVDYVKVSETVVIPSDNLKSNQLRCSDGSIITYNEKRDPKTLKCFAPLEIEKGWHVDRSRLLTFDELVETYTEKSKKYHAELEISKSIGGKKPTKPNFDIHIYTQIDTEFKFLEIIFKNQDINQLFTQESRKHIFTQINLLPEIGCKGHTLIFVHPQYETLINGQLKRLGKDPLPVLSCRDCDVYDYLRFALEWDVTIKNTTVKRLGFLAKLYITIGAHNAEAELNLIFHGQMLKRVIDLQKSIGYERIEKQSKVLRAIGERRDKYNGDYVTDWVSLQCETNINQDPEGYEPCLRLVDTIKSHGIVSLANFAQASGYVLDAKDLLSKNHKEDMIKAFLDQPSDVIAYSLGDVCNVEIQYSFKDQINQMAVDLEWENKTIIPALSIGATVDMADKAALATYLKLGDSKSSSTSWQKPINDYITEECTPYTPRQLVQNSAHTRSLLGKGFGGRIGQNQPTVTQIPRQFKTHKQGQERIPGIELKGIFKLRKIKGRYDVSIIVDIDISSCYAESQRMQLFFFGRPVIGGLRTDTISSNQYLTLKDWLIAQQVNIDSLVKLGDSLKGTGLAKNNLFGELIPGNFTLFINVDLENPQDLIVSYTHPTAQEHSILSKLLVDALNGNKDAIDKIKQGYTKILTHKITCGLINYDILQWLFFIANPKLRDEILEHSQILAFAIYPKSNQITSDKETFQEKFDDCQEQLKTIRANWQPTNHMGISYMDNIISYGEIYRDCHAWFGFTIGDLILNKYLNKRKVAQWIKKKCPQDLLYKLFCNTKYGVSISPLFNLSNIVIGNNITARARVLAWCMEKALNGFPTITDGCFFLINRILYPGRDPIDSRCINPDSPKSQLNQGKLQVKPLSFEFTGEDRNFTYHYKTKEWLMKDCRLLILCDVEQTKKANKTVKIFETLMPLVSPYFNPNTRVLNVKKSNIKPHQIDEIGKDFICNLAKEHITKIFPLMDVITAETNKITVVVKDEHKELKEDKKPDMVNIETPKRHGMADFEIKNIYHSGANQGMANYLLINSKYTVYTPEKNTNEEKTYYLQKHGLLLYPHEFKVDESKAWTHTFKENHYTKAYRGYESEKPHRAIVRDSDGVPIVSDRYKDNNPAIDLLIQIAENPTKINRQNIAIKLVSLSVNEYKKNYQKYDTLGLKPGDQFKRAILLTEFSVSTFKYKTDIQFFGWVSATTKSKQKYGQSIEAFFINSENYLEYQEMIKWCLDAIENNVIDPIEKLIKEAKKLKKFKSINRYHPEFDLLTHAKQVLVGEKHIHDEIEILSTEDLENDGELSEENLNWEDE